MPAFSDAIRRIASSQVWEPASIALRVHCAELLLERGHGKPAQAVAVFDPGDGSGNRSLQDLILASMAISADEVDEQRVIEHEPGSPSVEPP